MQTLKGSQRSSSSSAHQLSVEDDPELKAYIYQNLIDLQPYLKPESLLEVLIGQDADEDGKMEHALTLVATLGEYRLEAESQNQDIYEAFIAAKRKMLRQLEDWHKSSIDSSARDKQIQAVIEGRHLIH